VVEKTFVVDGGSADQIREENLHAAGEVRDEVAAELARGIGEAVRIAPRFRHQQQRHALDARAGDYHRTGAYFSFGARLAIQKPDAGGAIFA